LTDNAPFFSPPLFLGGFYSFTPTWPQRVTPRTGPVFTDLALFHVFSPVARDVHLTLKKGERWLIAFLRPHPPPMFSTSCHVNHWCKVFMLSYPPTCVFSSTSLRAGVPTQESMEMYGLFKMRCLGTNTALSYKKPLLKRLNPQEKQAISSL